eukprot:TRINITY_DN54165_c0_g1_i1.p1 TRINITY_DN54165_c0_g1~~TRINITY_DN54165_c0_g1_i1.p1  ORF type:complete len:235 (-),score=22.01 TRINITY_DN54165_c0_g1_i1:406-1110(-)
MMWKYWSSLALANSIVSTAAWILIWYYVPLRWVLCVMVAFKTVMRGLLAFNLIDEEEKTMTVMGMCVVPFPAVASMSQEMPESVHLMTQELTISIALDVFTDGVLFCAALMRQHRTAHPLSGHTLRSGRLAEMAFCAEDGAINGSSKDLSCSICLSSLRPSDAVLELRCHHVMHATCSSQWALLPQVADLENRYFCPMRCPREKTLFRFDLFDDLRWMAGPEHILNIPEGIARL